jgi:IS30 family transposase
MAQERARRPGSRRFTEEVRKHAEEKLSEGWTPEMISGRAKLEGRRSVCKETIYKHIYADAKAGGDLWKHLPRAHRKRRRRCPRADGNRKGKIPDQTMIDERPPEVDARAEAGHYEGDLIQGALGTGNLVTLVERKTRFSLVGYVSTKEAQEVCDEICRLFGILPAAARISLTLDNGKEFFYHDQIAQGTDMSVFFAHPYHSWERGTNENTNGLVRRLHPKKSSFAEIDIEALGRIDRYLNDRPKKCLEWQTPREAMNAWLSELAP